MVIVAAGCGKTLLRRGEDEEGVRLRAEVEVLGEGAANEEACVALHLQQVVLCLPHERYALELAKSVPLVLLLTHELPLGRLLICLRQHEVKDELLSPKYDTLDHVE